MKYQWHTFKEFVDKHSNSSDKIRRTRGKFAGWHTDGLGIRRAVFALPSGSTHHIPDYCLTAETRAYIESAKA